VQELVHARILRPAGPASMRRRPFPRRLHRARWPRRTV
jgi:hypothetical protein